MCEESLRREFMFEYDSRKSQPQKGEAKTPGGKACPNPVPMPRQCRANPSASTMHARGVPLPLTVFCRAVLCCALCRRFGRAWSGTRSACTIPSFRRPPRSNEASRCCSLERSALKQCATMKIAPGDCLFFFPCRVLSLRGSARYDSSKCMSWKTSRHEKVTIYKAFVSTKIRAFVSVRLCT